MEGKGSFAALDELNAIFVCPLDQFWRLLYMMNANMKVNVAWIHILSQPLPDMVNGRLMSVSLPQPMVSGKRP